ncbi:tRNA lysidine(34) synthetase TilS [Pseudidiomarina sp. 1APP75-27a]|uniref:tRNA lysidine(34) synthetase TilS n=1 Tax=Pseudidiomarina terrestris TaxID=2820060 RepID=UPI002B060DCD|nr:tRNA lysidine(34) synthetase TilS [Pseudidiomarina sp. 1APP75-27a]MEA3588802.1 tRNA lysidine(34) synthetase TilS [Pseudidiomarina sp. 1APP75-27a]
MSAEANDLYPQFCAALQEVELHPQQQLIACLGGGADSQTILDLLDRWRTEHPQFSYLAIHLDHQFHPSSGAWAQSLVEDCQRRNFPMYCEQLRVSQGSRISKEAAGRDARYQRLSELASDDAVFLLGQHRNDQIETFLLQLKRGAGPKGLAAMAQLSSRPGTQQKAQQRWLRPLLGVSKAQIYAYARQHQLHWIEDETNFDTAIDRNYLRHEVVPKLEQRWPQFGDAVLRSARLCAEQQQVLDELLQDQLTAYMDVAGALAVDPLRSHSAASQRALLRAWLEQQGAGMPSYAQLEQLRLQMIHTQNDKRPQVAWGDFIVKRTPSRHLVLEQRPAV